MKIEPLEAIRPQITTIDNQSFEKWFMISVYMLAIAIIPLWALTNEYRILAIITLILMNSALVQFMVGFMKKSMKLSNEWLTALSDITRQSKRSINTAITMLVSVAIIVATVLCGATMFLEICPTAEHMTIASSHRRKT